MAAPTTRLWRRQRSRRRSCVVCDRDPTNSGRARGRETISLTQQRTPTLSLAIILDVAECLPSAFFHRQVGAQGFQEGHAMPTTPTHE
jgi:hypothetical protein